jgi:flagellar hook-length control protein FliK
VPAPPATADGDADAPPSSDPAAGPGTSALPVGTTPVAATGSASSGSGSSSGEPGDRDRPATPAAGPAGPALPPVPTAPLAPTAPVAATPAAPPTPAAVAAQLVPHVAVLRGGPDGAQTMTVVLSPEELGPVQVQVTLDKGAVSLDLRGAHAAGREALMAALPDLRRDLQSAGLSCSRLDVDRDTGGSWTSQQNSQQASQQAQQQAAQQQAAQQQAGDRAGGTGRGARPWVRPTDLGAGRPAPASDVSASSGVDVRV